MTFQPINSLTSYLPTDIILPDDPEELRRILDDLLKKMTDAVNDKEIAHYNTVELLSGQKWFTSGNPQKFRNGYRKVIDFGALPNSATKSVAHGITFDANTTFTRIYGTATDPVGIFALPIPFSDPTALNANVSLTIDATNVVITTGINRAAYTKCYVIAEWLAY